MSPAYVPDPIELDEHLPVYVPEPENLEYHVPSDDDIQAEDQPFADDASPTAESPGYTADSDSIEDDTDTDFIDYPDEPGTDDEDPGMRMRIPRRISARSMIPRMRIRIPARNMIPRMRMRIPRRIPART
ncbi:hypothetical protein Tco_1535099 [Tanacetum coccineum]